MTIMYAACYRDRQQDKIHRASPENAIRSVAEKDLAFYREVDPGNEYILGQREIPEWEEVR